MFSQIYADCQINMETSNFHPDILLGDYVVWLVGIFELIFTENVTIF